MNRARDWLKPAERDLVAASHSAAAGHHEWAAFQSMRCAEMGTKALADTLGRTPRGRAVTEIFHQLPAGDQVPEPILDAARELDKVYVTARYPDGFASVAPADYFTEKTSRELFAHAKRVVEFCRSQIN